MTPERRAAETAMNDRLGDTLRKRAERQRRREAGEVRVEVWLSADLIAMLGSYGERTGLSRNDALKALIMREELRALKGADKQ